MGIGEPFDNFDNVINAIGILNNPKGLNIGARHISISTSGIVPKIYELADKKIQCTLSISLHATNDDKRTEMMPVNKAYPIKELIEACKYYIEKTNKRISFEYALAKARQENLLLLHKKNNWTILRPYITYDSNRLQLGGLEKESWLYRALSCNSIVFFKDIAEHYTTMTFGLDVAKVIYCLVGNKNAMGKCIQIASSESVKWHDIFRIYIEIIEEVTGKQLEVRWLSSFPYEMEKIFNKKYQIKYDRLYDRKFNSALVNKVCGKNFCYTNIRTGLRICLEDFIKSNANKFFSLDIQFEALLDRELGQKIVYRYLSSTKDKLNYLLWYYFPAFSIFFRKIRDKASKKHKL